MSVGYVHAGAREGIRELIRELTRELGKSQNRWNAHDVLFYVHSMKWIHLIAADSEPPRVMLIRPVNEFTVGYTTQVPCDAPAFDNRAEVFRTAQGRLHFRENGHILAAAEFATKLLDLVSEIDPAR